jgi:hypothetical protein
MPVGISRNRAGGTRSRVCLRKIGSILLALIRIALLLLPCGHLVRAQTCLGNIQSSYTSISKTTGNLMLDQAFNKELDRISGLYRIYPNFFMADDSRGGMNASAFDCGVTPGSRYTIVFGAHLMLNEFSLTGPNNYSIPAILAHEFTHIVQFQRGTVLPGTGKELQADFMAGWYTAKVNEWSFDRFSAISQSIVSFFMKGDDFINNNDPDPHGTREQRVAAIKAGMAIYSSSFNQAYSRSKELFSGGTSSGGGSGRDELQQSGPAAASDDCTRSADIRERACMRAKINACMRDCTTNYGYTEHECRTDLCNPSDGSNIRWKDACAKKREGWLQNCGR